MYLYKECCCEHVCANCLCGKLQRERPQPTFIGVRPKLAISHITTPKLHTTWTGKGALAHVLTE